MALTPKNDDTPSTPMEMPETPGHIMALCWGRMTAASPEAVIAAQVFARQALNSFLVA